MGKLPHSHYPPKPDHPKWRDRTEKEWRQHFDMKVAEAEKELDELKRRLSPPRGNKLIGRAWKEAYLRPNWKYPEILREKIASEEKARFRECMGKDIPAGERNLFIPLWIRWTPKLTPKAIRTSLKRLNVNAADITDFIEKYRDIGKRFALTEVRLADWFDHLLAKYPDITNDAAADITDRLGIPDLGYAAIVKRFRAHRRSSKG